MRGGVLDLIHEREETLIKEFLEDLLEDQRSVIDLNLERNMKAESHIEYNDIFNKRIEKYQKKLADSEQGGS